MIIHTNRNVINVVCFCHTYFLLVLPLRAVWNRWFWANWNCFQTKSHKHCLHGSQLVFTRYSFFHLLFSLVFVYFSIQYSKLPVCVDCFHLHILCQHTTFFFPGLFVCTSFCFTLSSSFFLSFSTVCFFLLRVCAKGDFSFPCAQRIASIVLILHELLHFTCRSRFNLPKKTPALCRQEWDNQTERSSQFGCSDLFGVFVLWFAASSSSLFLSFLYLGVLFLFHLVNYKAAWTQPIEWNELTTKTRRRKKPLSQNINTLFIVMQLVKCTPKDKDERQCQSEEASERQW